MRSLKFLAVLLMAMITLSAADSSKRRKEMKTICVPSPEGANESTADLLHATATKAFVTVQSMAISGAVLSPNTAVVGADLMQWKANEYGKSLGRLLMDERNRLGVDTEISD